MLLVSSNPIVLFDNMVENQSIQAQWPCILQARNDQTFSKKAIQRNGTKTLYIWRHTFLKQNRTRRLGYSLQCVGNLANPGPSLKHRLPVPWVKC